MFENPTRGRQGINFGTNVPKNLDLKSSSEQIFSKNWRWVPLLSSQFCCITQISPASLILPHRPHETSLKSSTRNSEGTDFFLITTANLVSRGLFPGFGRLPQNIRAGYDSPRKTRQNTSHTLQKTLYVSISNRSKQERFPQQWIPRPT